MREAIVGLLGVLIGSLLTQFVERKKRESEEQRWYADRLLTRRTEALINLHVATVECRETMNFYGNQHPRTLTEFREKVLPKEETFKRAMIIASIYLDEAQNEIMKSALGGFKQASTAIWLGLPDEECPAKKDSYPFETRQLDWKRFFEASDAAIDCLKGILNPEILDRLARAR